jgi:leader peptidase (prepilin peptidase) / N-methyltransferase
MQYVFGILIFLFGTALGSFVAVIANRYNTGLPWVKGRSICFSCNTELQKKDLFPIFSFIFLRGKCRYCGSKIPKETIFIELLMGFLSVLIALKTGLFVFNFSLLLATNYLLITSIFAVILLISVYDLKHFIIPDSFLISFFIFSLFYTLLPATNLPAQTGYFLLINFVSGIILALPFLLIFLISKGTWFGFGDVKYILVIGFFLGFSQGLSAIVLAFWIGAVFSLIILSFKKIAPRINLPLLKNNLTIKSEIPFGPFLSLGIVISFYLSLDLFHINELFNIF